MKCQMGENFVLMRGERTLLKEEDEGERETPNARLVLWDLHCLTFSSSEKEAPCLMNNTSNIIIIVLQSTTTVNTTFTNIIIVIIIIITQNILTNRSSS